MCSNGDVVGEKSEGGEMGPDIMSVAETSRRKDLLTCQVSVGKSRRPHNTSRDSASKQGQGVGGDTDTHEVHREVTKTGSIRDTGYARDDIKASEADEVSRFVNEQHSAHDGKIRTPVSQTG